MTPLSTRPATPSTGSKVTLISLGERALGLGLIAALPISAVIFIIQMV